MSITDTHDDAVAPQSSASNSSNGYCSFCILAEFDIDRGSTLSHQYPAPTGYDEHMLAELMLPDGVHARTEDWTFFFLKPPGSKRAALRETIDDEGNAQAPPAIEPEAWLSHDLTYVINLVRTKHDNTVRRGAMVKAMAIGTRYPFIEIFKPALLLALDDYFKEPGPDCLARLYESINKLDLSAAPSFSRAEKIVLRASDRRDLFEERFVTPARAEVEPAAIAVNTAAPITPSEEVETARSSPVGVAGSVEMTRRRTDSTSTFSSRPNLSKRSLALHRFGLLWVHAEARQPTRLLARQERQIEDPYPRPSVLYQAQQDLVIPTSSIRSSPTVPCHCQYVCHSPLSQKKWASTRSSSSFRLSQDRNRCRQAPSILICIPMVHPHIPSLCFSMPLPHRSASSSLAMVSPPIR